MVVRSCGVANVTPPIGDFISNLDHNLVLRTVSGGQFDWGGILLKSTVRFQRSAQAGWKSAEEHNGISRLYCETDRSSSHESGA